MSSQGKAKESNGLRSEFLKESIDAIGPLINRTHSDYEPGADPKMGAELCGLKKKGGCRNTVPVIDGFDNYSSKVKAIMKTWSEEDIKCYNKLTDKEKDIYINAIENESKITPELQEIVLKNGGDLVGLEYRIKSPSSVFGKIYLRPKSTPIQEMNDIIRYTEIIEAENLVECTKTTISDLESRGYEVAKLKNTWIDDKNPYNGINAQIKSTEGQMFELQFHTPESFALKNSEEMHGLYEQSRLLMDNDRLLERISMKMFELSDELERPQNIDSILNYEEGD